MHISPTVIQVLNYHLDGYGHVNNARYLEFLEAARWHFFRQHQMLDTLRETQLVVAQINIRYRRAATLNQELHILTRIQQIQSRQITLAQEIQFSGSLKTCVQAEIVLMPTNAEGCVFRLPENVLQQFKNIQAA